MALVLAVQHWRHYLMGRRFQVFTDHRSLKHLLQQKITTVDQQCWLSKLMGYQFEVVYKPGPENKAADALSRKEIDAELSAICMKPCWLDFTKIREETQTDSELTQLQDVLLADPDSKPGYCLREGLIFYDGRLLLSKSSSLIPILLQEFHSTPMGGHSGFTDI